MKRINVFTGHFGSGKTEIAINFAKKLKDEGKDVTIYDLDIVNPYFCVRDKIDDLNAYGIKVVSANPEWSNAELMVVTPEVMSAFYDKDKYVVMDIGGDDMGATVLGQYNKYFKDEPYDLFFVINNNRPFTEENKTAKDYINSIEVTSRLKVTKLISNTNLSYETSVEDVVRGDENVNKLAKEMNLEHAYTVVMKELQEEVKGKVHGEIFPIDIYMKPPWR